MLDMGRDARCGVRGLMFEVLGLQAQVLRIVSALCIPSAVTGCSPAAVPAEVSVVARLVASSVVAIDAASAAAHAAQPSNSSVISPSTRAVRAHSPGTRLPHNFCDKRLDGAVSARHRHKSVLETINRSQKFGPRKWPQFGEEQCRRTPTSTATKPARLEAIPRHLSDTNMVDHVGQQLQTAFGNILTLLFAGRLKKSVSLAGARSLAGHQRAPAPIWAMQAEVALQRGLPGMEEGEVVNHAWVEDPANRGRLLRHAVHTTREMEAAMAAWQLDMSDAGMLGVLTEQGVTSLTKFRNGALPDPANPGGYIAGPANSKVASRWDALLPNPRRQKLASPKHRFAQTVDTDGVTISVMFLRPKPAAPPAKLPRMAKGMGAVNSLAHLHAEWLGVDAGKTNMATVAHEERSADGSVVSVRHWTLTAGQYYRDSGITRQTQATKTWLTQVKTQLTALSRVSSKPSSLASYRQFADTVLATYNAMWAEVSKPRWANARFRLYCGKMRVVASFSAKVNKQAKKLWPDRILALAYGAAGFKGSGTIGCRGVPVSQMQKEAVKQFRPGRVVLVDEFRTSRVSSADNTPIGPGPRPTELCYWTNRPAMPKPGQPGQDWVEIADKPLLRKWQRQLQQ
ncbi:hypothetical protein QJQ45_028355 [Haematococcus lacustris]|nr:hypothetical protein QJQ45_028355 [Haematococcus lacustris]